MVVGSREAMAELSSQLAASLAAPAAAGAREWPPELLSASVAVGPYIESKHWRVSFHEEGSVPSERKALVARSGPPGWVSAVVLALAALGAVSLARFAWNAL